MRLYGTYDVYRAELESVNNIGIFCDGKDVLRCCEFNQCEGWAVGYDVNAEGEIYLIDGTDDVAMYGVSGNITLEAIK